MFILGDPGADSGGEGKSKRAEKMARLFFVPFFPTRLDFPSPPLSAPGSPRMLRVDCLKLVNNPRVNERSKSIFLT